MIVSPPPSSSPDFRGSPCGRSVNSRLRRSAALRRQCCGTGVCVEEPVHPPAQAAIGEWPDDEMEMIGSEAVGEDGHQRFDAGRFEGLEEGEIVAVVEEDIAAIVAAVEDLVANAAHCSPCGPRQAYCVGGAGN